MGHWGVGSLQNDQALDWIAGTGVHDFVVILVKKAIVGKTQTNYEEQRAAIDLLMGLESFLEDASLLEAAEERLQAMLDDEEFITDWENRGAIEKSINEQLLDVQGALIDRKVVPNVPEVIEVEVDSVTARPVDPLDAPRSVEPLDSPAASAWKGDLHDITASHRWDTANEAWVPIFRPDDESPKRRKFGE